MAVLVAADPGAWNIIAWMIVLGAIGAVILWVATTLVLRNGSGGEPEGSEPGRS